MVATVVAKRMRMANGRETRQWGMTQTWHSWHGVMCHVFYCTVYLLRARLYRHSPIRAPSVWRNEIHSFITLYNWEIKFFYFLWRASFFFLSRHVVVGIHFLLWRGFFLHFFFYFLVCVFIGKKGLIIGIKTIFDFSGAELGDNFVKNEIMTQVYPFDKALMGMRSPLLDNLWKRLIKYWKSYSILYLFEKMLQKKQAYN